MAQYLCYYYKNGHDLTKRLWQSYCAAYAVKGALPQNMVRRLLCVLGDRQKGL